MKVLFAVAVLAVLMHSAMSAPSGLLGLGGVLVAGPTTISQHSLVQTHPSPAVLVSAPVAVSPVVHGPIITGHLGSPLLDSPLALSGLGLGHGW